MTEYAINIKSIAPVDSCIHILQNIKWFKDIVLDAGYKIEREKFDVQFAIGDLTCRCDNENDFKAEALGHDISVYSASLSLYLEEDVSIYFSLDPFSNLVKKGKNVYINCNDKLILSDIVADLQKTVSSTPKPDISTPIVINANNSSSNIAVGSNNVVVTNKTSNEKKPLWKKIWEGIAEKITWVIVVAILLAVLAALGISQPDWLKL